MGGYIPPLDCIQPLESQLAATVLGHEKAGADLVREPRRLRGPAPRGDSTTTRTERGGGGEGLSSGTARGSVHSSDGSSAGDARQHACAQTVAPVRWPTIMCLNVCVTSKLESAIDILCTIMIFVALTHSQSVHDGITKLHQRLHLSPSQRFCTFVGPQQRQVE